MSSGYTVALADGRYVSLAGVEIRDSTRASYIVSKLCPPGSTVYLDIDEYAPVTEWRGVRAVVYAVSGGSLVNVNKMLVDERSATIEDHTVGGICPKGWWAADSIPAATQDTVIMGAIVLMGSFLGHVTITYVSENRGRAGVTGMRSKRAALFLSFWTFFSIIALLFVWNGVLWVLVRIASTVWALVWIIVFALAFSVRTVFINDLLGGFIVMGDSRIDIGMPIELRDRRGIVADVSMRRTLVALEDGSEYVIPNGQLSNMPYIGGPSKPPLGAVAGAAAGSGPPPGEDEGAE
jgi:small-conductance mechanosensitive channel